MDYQAYVGRFNEVWAYITQSRPQDSVDSLAKIRGYTTTNPIREFLENEIQLTFVTQHTAQELLDTPSELGLNTTDKNGKQFSLVRGRYVLPIRDVLGNVLALVGYYPDKRKYITTKSKFFFKNSLYLGLEQLPTLPADNRVTCLVEGIFDSLALRSVGIPALATMGITGSPYKTALYPALGTIVAIPDVDVEGRKVIEKNAWHLPMGSRYLTWNQWAIANPDDSSQVIHLKDVDNLVNVFGGAPLRDAVFSGYSGSLQLL